MLEWLIGGYLLGKWLNKKSEPVYVDENSLLYPLFEAKKALFEPIDDLFRRKKQ